MPQRATPDKIVGQHEKFLFYGGPKTGKTFAALTAPSPVYVVLFGGPNEIKTMYSREFQNQYGDQEIFFDVAFETIGERGEFNEATGFDHACDLIDDALEQDADPNNEFHFNTLVVDSATMLVMYQMHKAIELSFDTVASSGKGRIDKTAMQKLRDTGILIPADNDYLSQQSLNRKFVNWLFQIPKHVILVAHEWQNIVTDRATKKETLTQAKPWFYGKDRNDVPAIFDNVWRFVKDGQFYEVHTVADGDKFMAGTRVGGVLDRIVRNLDVSEAIRELQQFPQ